MPWPHRETLSTGSRLGTGGGRTQSRAFFMVGVCLLVDVSLAEQFGKLWHSDT